MHNQRGYILLLLFSILSLCMTLMSIFFTRTVTYQHLMHLLLQKDKATKLAIGSIEIGQALLSPAAEKEEKKQPVWAKGESNKPYYQTFFKTIFPYLHTNTTYTFTHQVEGINGSVQLYLQSENGKLNLNSLYDFRTKKFAYEGQNGDRKKICEWLFEKISKINHQPSLFAPFEQYLKKRTTDFNDITELLMIKEFAQAFNDTVFFQHEKTPSDKVYLTDIFTIATDQETINPWFFSYSWRIILGFPTKTMSKEEQTKVAESFKSKVNWEVDWNSCLKTIYQKEYKDLPQEIKSLLTTECEANIFSLLLSATIGETTATIFTILKKQVTEKPIPFDIVKMYQI